jgi:flagellar biosynthesis protein FlhA
VATILSKPSILSKEGLTRLGRSIFSEGAAAIAAVSIILMLVVPLPTWGLDILLALNITLALGVLMMTFYIKKSLEFSSFPSLLLLVTLFRLALNVSATRLILGTGHAGSVIAAFGTFVIGGNFVVGIVVFIVLVVIQFVVITSGSGRVAEVAARFTLDAMPGKQMAIDAELNSGAIDEVTARQRRQDVSREADFYGAMDGASKFVRGDAIASVVMIVINILGGFGIGILQRGMDITAAIQSYTILTVGEGIVTQIPALLISAASGLLVTRTASESNLSKELSQQVMAHPHALYISSGALFFLGMAPGLPKIPFALLAGAVAFYGYRLQVKRDAPPPAPPAAPKAPENLNDLLTVDPLEIELGYALLCLADPKQGGDLLDRVTAARRQIATELGMIVPPIRVRDNLRLRVGNQYVFRMRGQEIGGSELMPGQFLALEGGGEVQPLPGTPTQDPAFGVPAVWIAANQRKMAEVSGYTVVDPINILVTHLMEQLRRHASEILSRQDVQSLVDNVRRSSPAVVDELVPGLMSLGQVQKVLQILLRDRVSIRDLTSILEALSDAAASTRDPEVLAEHVRFRLSRQLTHQYVEADGRLYCMTLHPTVEQTLMDNLRRNDVGTQITLDPITQQRLGSAIRRQAERMAAAGHLPLLMCAPRLRSAIRPLIERSVPTLIVLSYAEITAGIAVESLGMVMLSDENPTV